MASMVFVLKSMVFRAYIDGEDCLYGVFAMLMKL
jgi:hypothetical protein